MCGNTGKFSENWVSLKETEEKNLWELLKQFREIIIFEKKFNKNLMRNWGKYEKSFTQIFDGKVGENKRNMSIW